MLGVDYGLARVGIAGTDRVGITAQPIETIKRDSDAQVSIRIAQIVRERKAILLVVGHPLEMSGQVGASARLVEAFIAELEKHVEAEITLWDERLTTVQAERALDEAGVRWKKRKQVVDQVAAVLLLQSYLDATG
jgi:putative Holliday junction resolvase